MLYFFHRHWTRRWERFYRRNHWHLALDVFLTIVVIVLAVIAVSLYFYRPAWPNWTGVNHQIVDVDNPPLQLEFSTPAEFFKRGEATALNISLVNSGQIVADDISLDFKSKTEDLTIERVEIIKQATAPLDEIQAVDGRVAIKRLAAGDRLILPIKIYWRGQTETSSRTFSGEVLANYRFGKQTIQQALLLPSFRLAAELTVSAAAYYNSPQGDQLGIGPLPPIVGIPTSYWVFWEARSLGDFKNLVMSAKLPLGVELTTNRAILAGELIYNLDSRQLVWKVQEIKHRADNYRASFEIELTPTADQVGQIAPLVLTSRYYAEDQASGLESNGELGILDSNLSADRINHGQGLVID